MVGPEVRLNKETSTTRESYTCVVQDVNSYPHFAAALEVAEPRDGSRLLGKRTRGFSDISLQLKNRNTISHPSIRHSLA